MTVPVVKPDRAELVDEVRRGRRLDLCKEWKPAAGEAVDHRAVFHRFASRAAAVESSFAAQG